MTKLIYSAISSLDGYIEDEDGKFDWAEPDEEAHKLINDLERSVGTYLYGRRMYETMLGWEARPRPRRAVGDREGLRSDLAGSRQGRVLEHACDRIHRQDADRERLRP
jgi:RibD C-terminal domain